MGKFLLGRPSFICPVCGSIFSKEFYQKEEFYVECPNCGIKEKTEKFKEIDYETNPIKMIGEFKSLLQDGERDQLIQYFKEVVKIYTLHFHNDNFVFTNSEGKQVSINEVHDYIKTDEKIWERLYNIYMTLYR